MEVKCDKCSELFPFAESKTKLEGVQVVYIECPNCGKKTFSYILDNQIRDRIKKTERLRKNLRKKAVTFAEKEARFKKLNKYIARTREIMQQKQVQYSNLIAQVMEE